MKTLSIIIPAFNEEKTILKLIKKVLQVNFGSWKREIIVVDDGSTDKTKFQISNFKFQIKNNNIRIITHKRNKGKGAAIQTGLKHATGDVFIVQDADLEYDPKDIPKLLKEFNKGDAQIIFGSRNLSLKEHVLFIWGINFSTFLINFLYGSNLSDLYTCYKLYDTRKLKTVQSKAIGFEWDIEIMVKLLKKGYKVSEVPINYHPRSFSEGKKIKPWDGVIGLWVIIKNKFF